MRLFFAVLFSFVLINISHSYTVKEIRSDLNAYQNQIEALKADFAITIDGAPSNAAANQKGEFSFNCATGSVLRYVKPMELVMEVRTNGEVYMNGIKNDKVGNSYNMGDIFFLYFLENYDLKVMKEDSNRVQLTGYKPQAVGKAPDTRVMVRLNFNKVMKVFDSIQYLGDGRDYPYVLTAAYDTIQGLPVLRQMNMRIAAFSINMTSRMTLDNITLTKKQ